MQNDLLQEILSRRSIRRYTAQEVPQVLLEQVLAAGANAPSAHNSMPWRFVVVRSAQGKQMLCRALQARFEADLRKAVFSETERSARLARSAAIFSSASALIIPFMKTQQPDNPLAQSIEIETRLAVQSAALAAGQMLLAAHALGLGSCWFAAPLFCAEEVTQACGLEPSAWQPQCLLTLGWPDESPKEKQPPRLDDVVDYM